MVFSYQLTAFTIADMQIMIIVYMCSGSRATLDKLLDNVEKPDRKGDKDIKGFVKAALDHFESAAKKIRSKKYAEAVKEFSKLCKETSNAFEAVNNKTV